ncbi:tyrosine-type recombinase/integrase [Pseudomonas sp. NFACC32-1]|uniref:tyrosine-type recombinase/integrase n=1 Tax=Pseudomonas sp. NFACC32-1 TaxID=1566198 RepID=UPI0035260410
MLQGAGLPGELYSSHSLRRGFATWATSSGWDLKALMQYFAWRDGQSTLRYVESKGVFPGQLNPSKLVLSANSPASIVAVTNNVCVLACRLGNPYAWPQADSH